MRGDLFRLLAIGEADAITAARILGDWQDERAIHALAQAAAFGTTSEVRQAAQQALNHLAKKPEVGEVLQRQLQTEPDSQLQRVMAMAAPGTAPLAATQTTPSPPPVQKDDKTLTDPDPTRMIYGPTAYTRKPGVWNVTIYNVAYWSMDYGINEHVEIGLQTVPPIGVVLALPHIKVGFDLAENVRLALNVTGGVLYPYIFNDDKIHFLGFGGGPILTVGTPDLMFNATVTAFYAAVGEENRVWQTGGGVNNYTDEMDYESTWSVTPSLGFSWRFARRVKLNIELYVPLGDHDYNGEVWVLLYGVRIFGQSIFGDISFVVPFTPYMEEYLQYCPIGFPLLSFGFQW